MTKTQLILVLDTDAYAGNFERELAAFCTGEVGDTSKGRREADDFRDARAFSGETELRPYADLVRRMPNTHDSSEVGHIWPTPGRVNDGNGRHMDAAAFDALPDRADRRPHPAYESVAIHLTAEPDAAALASFRARAEEYAAIGAGFGRMREPFRILGMRLVTRTTVVTETSRAV